MRVPTAWIIGAALVLPAPPTIAETFRAGDIQVDVMTVFGGLEHPWGMTFLPDGSVLVTERPGRLRVISSTQPGEARISEPIEGVPAVADKGQGGLLDVALDPAFSENRLVYLSYAEPRSGGKSATSVARGRLSPEANRLEDVQVVFRQTPTHGNGLHFGSRLAFAPDGSLFVTTGERFVLKEKAQDPKTHLGKVIHILPNGEPAPGNPGLSDTDWLPEIWSMGHRNVQGAAIHPATGKLWTIEHGPQGGDELNIPAAGRNYGWPVITYGIGYSGETIGIGTEKDGMEQPVWKWVPSIAPSGLAFYSGDLFPTWRGSVFTGALAGQMLVRLSLEGERVIGEERMLVDLGERIRDVRQGPDGALYLLTDAPDGRLLRITPRY